MTTQRLSKLLLTAVLAGMTAVAFAAGGGGGGGGGGGAGGGPGGGFGHGSAPGADSKQSMETKRVQATEKKRVRQQVNEGQGTMTRQRTEEAVQERVQQ